MNKMTGNGPPMRSRAITQGPSRAPARAMLKAAGFTDDDLRRPIIGVANTWIEIGPCNYHLRDLAAQVKAGIRAAGGTPMEFNTVSISDGVTMGSEGMKASLVSREVVADSIELVARGNLFDGLVVLVGCDKTIPGGVMALVRLDVPGLVLYGGSIAPGRWEGRDVTIQDVFEAVGAHAAGALTDARLAALEDAACPGPGACGGQFTANTMSTACELLGVSPMRANGVPAMSEEKAGAARRAGAIVMDVVRADLRPRRIVTREAMENAIAAVAATGGSTNAVLHLLAIAREAGVPLAIDDFDRISARTPLLADLKPGGRFVATDLHRAGGIGLVARRLQEAGLLPRRRADGHRRDDRRGGARRRRDRRPGGGPPGLRSDNPCGGPRHPERQLGAGRVRGEGGGPRAGDPPRSGPGVRQRGGGVRGGRARRDPGRRRRGHPVRGAEGRPGDARDAGGDGGDRRRPGSASRWRC